MILFVDQLCRSWFVEGRSIGAHILVVVPVDESPSWRGIVVHHPPDAKGIHVAEAAGSLSIRRIRLLLVILLGQHIPEAIAGGANAIVLGAGQAVQVIALNWPWTEASPIASRGERR